MQPSQKPAKNTASREDLDLILRHLESDLGLLKGERILITGATGFFGKWLTQALLAANDRFSLGLRLSIVTRDRARALLDSPWTQNRNEITWLEGDIRDLATTERFDSIIHGAAAASRDLNENRPDVMFETICEGTKRVLQVAENGPCRRLLFISSGAVYGPQPASLSHVPESYSGGPDPLDSRAAYGEAKRAAEFLCASHAQRLGYQVKIARCYAFLGPYLPLDLHFAAGNFLRNVLNDEPMKIGGDGTPLRSYLYAADLVVWLLKVLLKGESKRAYNVGSDVAISIQGLAEATHATGCKIMPKRSDLANAVTVAKSPVPGRAPEVYVPCVDRARTELGVEIFTPLSEALEKTLHWHLGNR